MSESIPAAGRETGGAAGARAAANAASTGTAVDCGASGAGGDSRASGEAAPAGPGASPARGGASAPGEVERTLERAFELEAAGARERALALYQDVLRRRDASPPPVAYERAAVILEEQRRYQAALDVCERALAEASLSDEDEAQFLQRRLRLERKVAREA